MEWLVGLGVFVVLVGVVVKWALAPRPMELAAKAVARIEEEHPVPFVDIQRCDANVQVLAYLEVCRRMVHIRRFEQAWECLQAAAAHNPTACVEAAADLALTTHRHGLAIGILEAAVEREPDVVAHRVRLGELLLMDDRAPDALELYQGLGNDPMLDVGRAEAMAALGREGEALGLLQGLRPFLAARAGGVEGMQGRPHELQACRRALALLRALAAERAD